MKPKIISSLSGGKDSIAQTLWLIEHYGVAQVIAHYQYLPEDWDETLPYVQEFCTHIGIQLIAQQIIYEPVGDDRAVRRREIRTLGNPADAIPYGNSAIAGITDLALRRRWPPSPSARFCTSYFKRDLLNTWIVQNQPWLGSDVIVALGERAAESPRRTRKPELWPRLIRKNWTAWNWLPVHQYGRRDAFRHLRDWGIAPHPAYGYQGMTAREMYDTDEEGGPRCGCRFCIYNTNADVCHQAEMATNRALLQRIVSVETTIGRTWWMQRAALSVLTGLRPRFGGSKQNTSLL